MLVKSKYILQNLKATYFKRYWISLQTIATSKIKMFGNNYKSSVYCSTVNIYRFLTGSACIIYRRLQLEMAKIKLIIFLIF